MEPNDTVACLHLGVYCAAVRRSCDLTGPQPDPLAEVVESGVQVAVHEDADTSLRRSIEHGRFLQEREQIVSRGSSRRQQRNETVAEAIGRLEAAIQLRELAPHHIAEIAILVVERPADLTEGQPEPPKL